MEEIFNITGLQICTKSDTDVVSQSSCSLIFWRVKLGEQINRNWRDFEHKSLSKRICAYSPFMLVVWSSCGMGAHV